MGTSLSTWLYKSLFEGRFLMIVCITPRCAALRLAWGFG